MPMTTSLLDEMIYLEQAGWTLAKEDGEISIFYSMGMPHLEIMCVQKSKTEHHRNSIILRSRRTGRALNYLTGKKAHVAALSRREDY